MEFCDSTASNSCHFIHNHKWHYMERHQYIQDSSSGHAESLHRVLCQFNRWMLSYSMISAHADLLEMAGRCISGDHRGPEYSSCWHKERIHHFRTIRWIVSRTDRQTCQSVGDTRASQRICKASRLYHVSLSQMNLFLANISRDFCVWATAISNFLQQ